MQTISWTYEHFVGDAFQGHEHFGCHCVTAISRQKSGIFLCYTQNDAGHSYERFHSKEEAVHFITQKSKPTYVQVFGTSYELQYLENNTAEWCELHDNWLEFWGKLLKHRRLWTLPWYMRLCIVLKENLSAIFNRRKYEQKEL